MFSSDFLRLSCLKKVATACLPWERWAQRCVCMCVWGGMGGDKEAHLPPIRRVLHLGSSFCQRNTSACEPCSCDGQLSSRKDAELPIGQGRIAIQWVGKERIYLFTHQTCSYLLTWLPSVHRKVEWLDKWQMTLSEVDVNLPTSGRSWCLPSIPSSLGRCLKFDHLYRDLRLQHVLGSVFLVASLPCFIELGVFDLSSAEIPHKYSVWLV